MTLRIGLVGAGPWSRTFHAPMLAAAPDVALTAVWARRPAAAAELAGEYGGVAVESFDALLERCEAVAFAVPPDVQVKLALRAAEAGKHLLLEKPLAFTLGDAERLTRAVEDAGVASLVVLRLRFEPAVRSLLARAAAARSLGAQASFLGSGSLPGEPFATPWRVERGALLDLAPHVLDLLDAAVGPIGSLSATGDPLRLVCLTAEHEGGQVSQAALSITAPGASNALALRVFTDRGELGFDGRQDGSDSAAGELVAHFAHVVETGERHALDVRRGLELQRLIDLAEHSLAGH
ncbi:MAG: Gfo/Idh/MocA family protein [Nocardioides sp.]